MYTSIFQFVESGGVPFLLKLLRRINKFKSSSWAPSCVCTCSLLLEVLYASDEFRTLIASCGGVQILTRLLELSSAYKTTDPADPAMASYVVITVLTSRLLRCLSAFPAHRKDFADSGTARVLIVNIKVNF